MGSFSTSLKTILCVDRSNFYKYKTHATVWSLQFPACFTAFAGVSCNLPLMQSILLEQFTAQSNTIKSFTMLFANIGADRADRADQSICSSALVYYWLKFQGET